MLNYFFRVALLSLPVLLSAGQASAREDLTARGALVARERCAACHGADGRGVAPDYPSLAGQHAEYIVKQIFNFKTGLRANPVMEPVVEQLLAVDIRAVSQYYATLPAGSLASADETLLREGQALYFRGNAGSGVSPCVACHGVYATGGAYMPRLAGQSPVYLEKQLRGFVEQTRRNDRQMHVSLLAITERELRAVAAYIANDE